VVNSTGKSHHESQSKTVITILPEVVIMPFQIPLISVYWSNNIYLITVHFMEYATVSNQYLSITIKSCLVCHKCSYTIFQIEYKLLFIKVKLCQLLVDVHRILKVNIQ